MPNEAIDTNWIPPDLPEPSRETMEDFVCIAKVRADFMSARASNALTFRDTIDDATHKTNLEKYYAETSDWLQAEGVVAETVDESMLKDWHSLGAYNTIMSAHRAIEIAAISIAHASLDEFLFQVARIGFFVHRDAMLDRIRSRKITIEDATSKDKEQIFAEHAHNWIESDLQRASLTRKFDWAQQLYKCDPPFSGSHNYDTERLERITETRNNAIHGDASLLNGLNVGEEVTWIISLPFVIALQIAKAEGFRYDPYMLMYGRRFADLFPDGQS